jgi:hypothetical protein
MRTTVLYKPTRVLNWTETWIDSSVKDAQNLPGGFNIYHDDRNLNGGGVLLAVKDTLLTSAVPELQTNCEIVWCKLEIVGHKTVYLSTYYNPKTSNEGSFDEYKTSIERASSTKNSLIISAGDFNLSGWDWYTKSLKCQTLCVRIHNKFMDIVDVNPQRAKQKPRNMPLYKKANWKNIKEDLKSIRNTVNTMKEMNQPINSIWDHFQTSLEESIDFQSNRPQNESQIGPKK